MPRKPRIEYDGAFYHIITRGNQKQKIFKEPPDYQKYLKILAAYKQRYHFRLYAYVLMGNQLSTLPVRGQNVILSEVKILINS